MTPEREAVDAVRPPAYPFAAQADVPPLDEDADAGTLFQEINERRARIENAELLRHLRGL
jgi:hypothetical protein